MNLVNVRFHFSLAAESIGRNGVILRDDQAIKISRKRAGMSSHLIIPKTFFISTSGLVGVWTKHWTG